MDAFIAEMQKRLAEFRRQGLYRELREIGSPQGLEIEFDGRRLLNFSSNDYLGLANHPVLKAAAIQAIEHYGAGAGASRLICGSLPPHAVLERSLAQFKGAAAALSFSSGYAAALGTLGALRESIDIVVLDRLVHACVVDAARLCGARLRVFAHNDPNDLERILRWADSRPSSHDAVKRARVLVITESVFSMDGDLAPLREIVALKEKHGAWLMLDEAHATGLYGLHGGGLAAAMGVADRIEIQMGTLSKALGSAGGFICGSRALIDLLINRARSFIFSTAPPPAVVAAAHAAVQWVQSPVGDEQRERLWQRVDELRAGREPGQVSSGASAPSVPRTTPAAPVTPTASAILPILVGEESKAMAAAASLRALGFFIPAVRFPSVARGRARLRVTLTATHRPEHIEQLLAALPRVL